MIIKVKVVPRAKKEKIEEFNGGLKVWLKEPAEKGKANAALIKKLADYFNISKSKIKITSGLYSREKSIKVLKLSKKAKIFGEKLN